MGQSFSLGRISGIRIGVNWSVLLIVALLAYGLAAGEFPAAAPRHPVAEYVVAAVRDRGGLHRVAARARAGAFAGGAA